VKGRRLKVHDLGPHCDPHAGCVTCGDEAAPMRVVRIDSLRELALCEDGEGSRSSVEIELVKPLAEGDSVLVHAGVALARLAPGEAA
jgi:hydrogenase maturation factor